MAAMREFRHRRDCYGNGKWIVGQKWPNAKQPQFKWIGFGVSAEKACKAIQFRSESDLAVNIPSHQADFIVVIKAISGSDEVVTHLG